VKLQLCSLYTPSRHGQGHFHLFYRSFPIIFSSAILPLPYLSPLYRVLIVVLFSFFLLFNFPFSILSPFSILPVLFDALVTKISKNAPISFTMTVSPRATFGEMLGGFSVNLITASFTGNASVLQY
jgi:hypothetical protein